MGAPSNVWGARCEPSEEWAVGVRGARLLERGPTMRLVSAVWELDPGARSPHYHLHHATEELLVVLAGSPTVRTPSGERTLTEGDVLHFGRGADGAHQVLNRSDGVVRYLMVAAHAGLDVIEYVDENEIVAYSHARSLLGDGGTLFLRHRTG